MKPLWKRRNSRKPKNWLKLRPPAPAALYRAIYSNWHGVQPSMLLAPFLSKARGCWGISAESRRQRRCGRPVPMEWHALETDQRSAGCKAPPHIPILFPCRLAEIAVDCGCRSFTAPSDLQLETVPRRLLALGIDWSQRVVL